jgi:predicted RNA-binding Zn-ribbon protein involved in translation (DUF1610 family)
MAKCPKCNKEIIYLNNYQSGESHHRLYSDGEYEEREFQPNNKTNEYECPECCEVLFIDEEHAKEFIIDRAV